MTHSLSDKVKEYAERIDPQVRRGISALSRDVDFAIVAFLLENRVARFSELQEQLGIAKNALTYSLRKLLRNGVVVRHYSGDLEDEGSYYAVPESTLDLVSSTATILDRMTTKSPSYYRSPSTRELIELIMERTAANIQKEPGFIRSLGDLFIFGNNILPRMFANPEIGKYLERALITAFSDSSEDITILSHELEVSSLSMLKWAIINQVLGYFAFCDKFAQFSKNIESTYRSTRIAHGMKMLEQSQFDTLRKLGTLREE